MLAQVLKSSRSDYLKKCREHLSLLIGLLFFSILIDLCRDLFNTSDMEKFLFGLFEVIGSCVFYALILGRLLGLQKFNFLNFFVYLRVNILYSLFYLLGALVLIIPGLYILTFFYFAPILALEGVECESYFSKSREMTKKSPWSALAVSLSLVFLMILDLLFLGYVKEAALSGELELIVLVGFNALIVAFDLFFFLVSIELYKKLRA
ncbi:hypothetical protein [Halobacteriovorax marinus]|uniref:hypothetical protein n=1 Tax=Halobacteriovorax marinus TaxID=97084 RepID=UPI003A90749C